MRLDNESRRVAALRQYDVLDTPREEDFDKITAMSARLFNVELVCVTLVDKNRFFFKSAHGTSAREMDRRPGFCDTAVRQEGVHCIEDATCDAVVRDHPLVCNAPFVRSYAGSPLKTSTGYSIGTLCMMDSKVRTFSESEKRLLEELAEFVMFHLDKRRLRAEEKQREENRRDVQKLESLGMLAGGIAHDFNNLLVGVLGNASLATRQIEKDSPAQEALADIVRAADQASELTDQLLAYAGQRPAKPIPVDLVSLFDNMAPLLRSSTGSGIELSTEFEERLPAAIGDPSQLRQIILNLATNACDAYQGGSGTIHIRLSRTEVRHTENDKSRYAGIDSGHYIRLDVEDHGCGMDERTLQTMFSPFFSTKVSGRGLGMSIVQRIVGGHGGSIEVESAEGQGCRVSVLLPADIEAAPTATIDDRSATPLIQGSGTVLIVDDDELVIRITKSAVESFGFDTVVASTGQAALDLMQSCGPLEMLILDATMPGMSGASTLRAIQEHFPDLPTVVTSGHHFDEVAETFDGLEELTFLQKPWKISQLSDAIDTTLHRDEMRQADAI